MLPRKCIQITQYLHGKWVEVARLSFKGTDEDALNELYNVIKRDGSIIHYLQDTFGTIGCFNKDHGPIKAQVRWLF